MVSARLIFLARASAMALMLGAGLSTSALAEPMSEAVTAALKAHPSVEAALANLEALDQEHREKRSDYFPQLNVSSTAGRIYGDNSTSRGLSVTRGAGYSGLWEGSVSVRQLLFDGFETTKRIDAAGARRESAVYNIDDVREQLALRTVIAYLDVLRGRESVARLNQHAQKIQTYIGRIEKMVNEGAADTSILEQARDIHAQLQNTLVSSEGQLRVAQATYMELTGHPSSDPMEKPAVPHDIIPDTAADAVAFAGENHPALRAAEMSEEALAFDAAAEKAAFYPEFTGELSYLEKDQRDLIGGEVEDGRAVVRMNWNYAVGGAQQARMRKAVQRRAESRAQREDRKRQITREIEMAYSDARVAQEQVEVQKSRVRINEGLLRAHEAQFEAAKVGILQILQSENALFNARLALMNGEFRYTASQFAILASIGNLQSAMMMPVAPVYHGK